MGSSTSTCALLVARPYIGGMFAAKCTLRDEGDEQSDAGVFEAGPIPPASAALRGRYAVRCLRAEAGGSAGRTGGESGCDQGRAAQNDTDFLTINTKSIPLMKNIGIFSLTPLWPSWYILSAVP
jgi:hypothetical protein